MKWYFRESSVIQIAFRPFLGNEAAIGFPGYVKANMIFFKDGGFVSHRQLAANKPSPIPGFVPR